MTLAPILRIYCLSHYKNLCSLKTTAALLNCLHVHVFPLIKPEAAFHAERNQ